MVNLGWEYPAHLLQPLTRGMGGHAHARDGGLAPLLLQQQLHAAAHQQVHIFVRRASTGSTSKSLMLFKAIVGNTLMYMTFFRYSFEYHVNMTYYKNISYILLY